METTTSTTTPEAVKTTAATVVRLQDVALAAVAEVCAPDASSSSQEDQFLRHLFGAMRACGSSLAAVLDGCLAAPASGDDRLVWLGRELQLSRVEIVAVALAAAVEDNPLVGRMLAHVQAPVGGSRPTLGLLMGALQRIAPGSNVLPALVDGPAATSGLLVVLNDAAPLAERPVMVPAPLGLALAGHDSAMPGATIASADTAPVPLADSVRARARQHALALAAEGARALALRSGSPAEGRSVALAIARALNRQPAFIESDRVGGFGPWLLLRGLLPVFCVELVPGERRRLPPLPGYRGPVLIVCGPDGSIELPSASVTSWILPIPQRDERRNLWLAALDGAGPHLHQASGAADLAGELAADHRHGTGRIAHLGRLARHQAALDGRSSIERQDVVAAAWTGEGGGLDALAEPLRGSVADDALVVAAPLRAELETLMLRCRAREDLADGLGASATTRYRSGVRALFTGPSGTGKTLAAGWIATRLGLPLYRVDLAAVTSKYIGETEKNLSQLLARAEQADVILLFDEADSLFGRRTEINDANDRFANAQTNYLLQRLEHYDGIVVLTSNSQARFDDAFARRLDFIVDFPLPGPDERRALWLSHLGPLTSLTPAELNQLAVLVDLTGGQTRNVVLAAAVHARRDRRPIAFADLVAGIEAELRKLGRQLPVELAMPS